MGTQLLGVWFAAVMSDCWNVLPMRTLPTWSHDGSSISRASANLVNLLSS